MITYFLQDFLFVFFLSFHYDVIGQPIKFCGEKKGTGQLNLENLNKTEKLAQLSLIR